MNRKEFYNRLSDDVKRKIKACKTEEEMIKVPGEKIGLDPGLPEAVKEISIPGVHMPGRHAVLWKKLTADMAVDERAWHWACTHEKARRKTHEAFASKGLPSAGLEG